MALCPAGREDNHALSEALGTVHKLLDLFWTRSSSPEAELGQVQRKKRCLISGRFLSKVERIANTTRPLRCSICPLLMSATHEQGEGQEKRESRAELGASQEQNDSRKPRAQPGSAW